MEKASHQDTKAQSFWIERSVEIPFLIFISCVILYFSDNQRVSRLSRDIDENPTSRCQERTPDSVANLHFLSDFML
jgi:hypothetical protein